MEDLESEILDKIALFLMAISLGCVSTATIRKQWEEEFASQVSQLNAQKVFPSCGSGESSSYYCGFRVEKLDYKAYRDQYCRDTMPGGRRDLDCRESWSVQIVNEWKEIYEFASWQEAVAKANSSRACDEKCLELILMDSHNAAIDAQITEIEGKREAVISDKEREHRQKTMAAIGVFLQEMGRGLSQSSQLSTKESQPVVVPVGGGSATYRQVGNTTYDDRGNSWRTIGNVTYGSDGTTYRRNGNFIYSSEGTNYQRIGNTVYGSDGSSSTKIGNTTYISNGRTCRRIGSSIYCE